MFTLVAFSEKHPTAATEDAILAVPDQSHKVSGDDIYIGKWNRIVGLHAYGHSIGLARVVSPSLRAKSSIYISPLVNDLGDYGQFTTRDFDDRHDCAMPIVSGEALNAYVTDTEISATENDVVGVWLADAPIVPVKGAIWTVRATAAAIVGVEKSWVNGEMAWTPDLPMGRYQVVGARCYIGSGGLYRFVFIGESHRPGGICVHEQHLQEEQAFRVGNLGVWGEFDSVTPPSLDILPRLVAGTTGAYLMIDLIKIA